MKTGIVFLFIVSFSFNSFSFGRNCGTVEPSLAEKIALKASAQKRSVFQFKTIKTIVHYLSEEEPDNDVILSQIHVLNEGFRSQGFQFDLFKVNTVKEREKISAFRRGMGSLSDRVKQELHEGDDGTLNIYVAPLNGLLGWATWPWDVEHNPLNDGVVVDKGSLPGGNNEPYNLGQTLTHEVGHWLGLYHTFQGGCSDRGDLIADTPSHSGPTYGCPAATVSRCNGETEKVPVSNFMNYSDDICMTEFSPLQRERMQSAFAIYRSEFEKLAF